MNMEGIRYGKVVKRKKLKYGDRDHLGSIKTKSGKEVGGRFF